MAKNPMFRPVLGVFVVKRSVCDVCYTFYSIKFYNNNNI